MRGAAAFLALSAAAGLAAARLAAGGSGAAPAASPEGLPGYEGSGSCAACHAEQHDQWKGSLHARTIHEPTEAERALLARSLLCGEFEARWVLGEKHARRFLVPSGTEPGRHVLLPCRHDTGSAEWTHLHESDWKSLTWERSCGACHATGFDSDDLTYREPGVGCEACHGPASRHGARETRGGMIAYTALSAAEEVTICASCHLQGGRSRSTGLTFARNYEAGGDLFSDYRFDWAGLDRPEASAAGPIDAHQKILIRRAVVAGGKELRCTSCHEFHRMGHDRHRALPRQEYCHTCHEATDFKLKEYAQSCNVCEF